MSVYAQAVRRVAVPLNRWAKGISRRRLEEFCAATAWRR